MCDWHHMSVEGFKLVGLRNSSGSLAMFAAIRRASPRIWSNTRLSRVYLL
jgi:hypothetical protein